MWLTQYLSRNTEGIGVLIKLTNIKTTTKPNIMYVYAFRNNTIITGSRLVQYFFKLKLPNIVLHHRKPDCPFCRVKYWLLEMLSQIANSQGALGFNLERKCRKLKFSGKLFRCPLNTLVKSPPKSQQRNFFIRDGRHCPWSPIVIA